MNVMKTMKTMNTMNTMKTMNTMNKMNHSINRRHTVTAVMASLVLLLAALLLVACAAGGGAGEAAGSANTTPGSADPGAGQAPHSVVDYIGREVAIPEKVDSVAIMYAYIGQLTVLLDGGDKISAAVAGMQRDELLMRKVPGIADMPVPFRSSSINIESLMEIRPDMTLIRYETAANPGEMENLAKSGLAYAVVDFYNIEEQKESVRLVGALIGKTEQAERYLDYYDKTLALVASRVSAIPETQRVSVYHSVNEVVRTNHPKEISYYVLEAAGCINVARDFGTAEMGGKVNVSVEQIYLWDPDCVIANESAAVRYFNTNEAFAGLRAVREGRVYQLPVGASRWGHPGSIETPIATLYIAKLLYPQYFEDIDIRQEIENFYAEFWGIDLDPDDIDSIISGVGMRAPKDGSQ